MDCQTNVGGNRERRPQQALVDTRLFRCTTTDLDGTMESKKEEGHREEEE